MHVRHACDVALTIALAMTLAPAPPAAAQGRLAGARELRCTFSRSATGSWAADGAAAAVVKPSTLVLRFDTIDFDDGTARLRNGSVGSEVTARTAEGYAHFMQSFRTGPLYTTTVFDRGERGRLKAVHSRHEYFTVPLPGATSSPEQYYGDCEIVK